MVNIISFPKLDWSFEISREALHIGSFSVYWYGVIIGIGLCLAFWYALSESKRVGLSEDHLLNLVLTAVPVAIICARLYYVLFSWSYYKSNPLQIFNIRGGGLAIYGGVIGAIVTIFIYCRKTKINIGTVLDILAVGLLIGQAIGRWGNFVNGEAFGSYTSLPWGMSIVTDGEQIATSVHPTFLYESLWNVAGLFTLTLYKKHRKFEGEVFCGYISWYGVGRFWIEALRADSLLIGVLKVSQIVALISVLVGIGIIIYGRKKKI